MYLRTAMAIFVIALTSGCASIVSGTSQSVSVVGKTAELEDIVGARCTLTNNKGEWYATTPGSVVVQRSFGEMAVNCIHGTATGVTQAKSSTKPIAFGNILFGGLIGAGVDMANGAAYEYPTVITVPMIPTKAPAPAAQAAVPPLQGSLQATQAPQVQAAPLPVSEKPTPVPAEKPSPVAPVPSDSGSIRSDGGGRTVPASAPASTSVKVGTDSFNAERLAQANACPSSTRALLIGKGPGYESFAVNCNNGESMAIRCDFGNCRILQ